ncbi:hypothetical protein ACFS7Z_18755 [Pontibacter toksunensis]|uniref:Uncharacterized protein n=1 Tax=Pontibacter toksunensis TaxID=1332631 RepID=A0ABW6C169_9BACT
MIIDLDKGIKGLVIHHQPITEVQLKRLLLIFDEVYFTPPSDNLFFLEKGSICYSYYPDKNGVAIYSMNGFDMLHHYANVPSPEVSEDKLRVATIHSYGGSENTRVGAYQAVVMSDILPLFNDKAYSKDEDALLNKFELALKRDLLKVLDYKNSDFYMRNSIALKIAYDNDAIDKRAASFLAPLLVKKKREDNKMFIPSPSFPKMYGVNIFPGTKYIDLFPKENNRLYDYNRQFYSIIARVNKKLALCGEHDLVPIFLDQHIYNFFNYKVEKSKKNKEEGVNAEWQKSYNIPLFNLSQISIQASDIHISDSVLRNLTIPEIVSYKERCLLNLYRLRKSFINDLNEIIKSDYGLSFDREVDKFMHSKIIPDLKKYQRAQADTLQKIVKGAITFSVGAATSHLGTIQGLSPNLIALLGGTSPLFSEALLQLSDKVRDRRRKQYENTFAYFLKLK